MKIKFEQWWDRIEKPGWVWKIQNTLSCKNDIKNLCQKAYALGIRHERQKQKQNGK